MIGGASHSRTAAGFGRSGSPNPNPDHPFFQASYLTNELGPWEPAPV
jgi:hypothetical protein